MRLEETVAAFKRGDLEIDCPHVTLIPRKKGGAVYQGPGYIRQAKTGYLSFKVYALECEPTDLLDFFKVQTSVDPGKLLPDDNFYDLEAVSIDGTHWIAERVRLDFDWRLGQCNAVLYGQAYSFCGYTSTPHEQQYLELHFFDKYDVPLSLMSHSEEGGRISMTRNQAEFNASGCHFSVFGSDDDTVFKVTSNDAFPPALSQRIQEALQFLTARPAQWRARIQTEEKELCLELMSPWRKSTRSQSSAPLSHHNITFINQGWPIFISFLDYVIANTEHTYWNPIAFHLNDAYEGSSNSLDARALTTAVAAEAVASLINVCPDTEKDQRLARFQKLLLEFVQTQTAFSDLATRMHGLIETLGKKRPQDKMHFLADNDLVEPLYIKSYSNIRNRHVHPNIKHLEKPDLIKMQNLLDEIYKVEVLINQMVFHIIGYKGPFTDYGAVNFPIKQYPPSKP